MNPFVRTLITALSVLLPYLAHARLQGKARVDSLLTELSSHNRKDTNRVKLLDDIAYSYKTMDPGVGIMYASEELKLATILNWKPGIAKANSKLSLNYQFKYDYPNALAYGFKAIKLFEELGDKKGAAEVKSGIANVYSQMNNYAKGLEYHMEALKVFEETHDLKSIATTQGNIGNIYQELNDYPQALLYDMNALKVFEKLDDRSGIARNLGNIGNIYLQLGEYSEALEYNFKALKIFEELGERNGQGLISGNIGEIYFVIDTSGKAITGKHIPAGKKAQLSLAIEYLKKGTDICREINMLGGEVEFSANLARAYTLAGNYKEALKYSKEYNSVKYSMYSQEKIQKVAMLDGEREKEIKEKEIEVQRLQLIANKNARRYYIAGLSMLVLLSAGLFRRFRTARKVRQQLEEKNSIIKAEKENADMLRIRAERSEQFRHQFLTNMSHEIRTPMYAVNGMTDLLLDKDPRPEQLHYLKVISKSSDILLHIVDDILDLSKIEAGKMDLEAIDFSLADTIRQVKETLSFRAEEKGLLLVAGIDDTIPPVLIGDPFRLNQILINLGGNAIKFTDKGTVSITVRLLKSEDEEITLRFTVSDTGIGIPADKIGKLFQNFSQVQNSDTRIYGGTGLGLSISKQLVELQGGTISVESAVGRGSSFSFELTFHEGSLKRLNQKAQDERKADGSILNGMHILLVDDNDYNRMVIVETLHSKAEVTIDEAVNGQEAIDKLLLHDYDVVLMDIRMPVMNGLDATRYIRNNMRHPKNAVPVVAITASLLREDSNLCTDAGMNGYLSKPFKTWQLISVLSKVTGRHITKIKARRGQEKTITITEDTPGADAVTDLTYLSRFCDADHERMKKFITAYIVSVPLFTGKIKAAIAANDKDEVAIQVHALKPRLRMMGMAQNRELADKIEQYIRDNADMELADSVALFISNAEKSVKELEEKI